MPTNITSASEITKRANNKAIANNFINRIQRANISGYGTPTGIYDSSIINDIITGNMTTYTKCDTGYNINYGCECSSTSNINSSPQPPIPPSSGGNATYFGLSGGGPNVNSTSLANGSEIVMGTFNDTINLFDLNNVTPTPVRMTLTSPTSSGAYLCTYIAKYDASGILLGATKICSSFGNASGFSICSDSTSLYITGQTVGTTFFYEGSTSDPTDIIGNISRPDGNTNIPYMFIAKYDLILNSIVWAIPSTANLGFSITVSGNYLVITGNFIQTAKFYDKGLFPPNPDTPFASFNILDPNSQTFIVLYNISGIINWVTYGLGATTALYTSVVFDENATNLYVTGSVSGSLRLYNYNNANPSSPGFLFTMIGSVGIDAIIAKYNINGQVQWATKLLSNRNERALSISYYDSNIYVTGLYAQSLNIYNANGTSNPTVIAYNLSSIQLSTHAYIVKFNSDGELKWANKIDDGPISPTGVASGNSIVSDATGIYITGSIQGTVQVYNPAIINTITPIITSILTTILLPVEGLSTRAISSKTYYRLKDRSNNDIPLIDLVTGNIIQNSYVEARLNSNGEYIDAFDEVIVNITDSDTSSNSTIPFNFTTIGSQRCILVAKYNLDGNLQWITYVGNPNTGLSPPTISQGSDIIINGSQLWVCGQIVGSVNIYEGNGINPPDTISPAPITFDFTSLDSNQRGILIKYNLDGHF